MPEIEKGGSTSEFIQSAIGVLVAALPAIRSESDLIKGIALGCVTVIVCVYVYARTSRKNSAA